jgi:hypothetical protein
MRLTASANSGATERGHHGRQLLVGGERDGVRHHDLAQVRLLLESLDGGPGEQPDHATRHFFGCLNGVSLQK